MRLNMNLANPKNPSLLVAMPQLQDPNFRRAVVLIIDHSPEGALGFVINKRSPLQLRGILADADFPIPVDTPVWSGGPVLSANGVILHNEAPGASDTEIVPGVCLSSDKNLIAKYCAYYDGHPSANLDCLYPYRFLVGYAGWGPGQLDAEIRMGTWIQASIDKEITFDIKEENIWNACLKAIGIKDENSLLLADSPFLN
jgi:putative transcriptional regulator